MNKLHINLRKVKFMRYNGILTAVCLAIVGAVLCYTLLHNPYKKVHEQIFQTADNIRKYYADQPGYWKLSTQSAINDRLTADSLATQKEFELKIGIGENGEMAMPSDNDFDIALKGLNKSLCIGLSEAHIGNTEQLGLQKITLINENGTTEFTWGDENYPLPVKKYAARNICLPSGNTVMWTFH